MSRIFLCCAFFVLVSALVPAQVVYMDGGEVSWSVMVTKEKVAGDDLFFWTQTDSAGGVNLILLRDGGVLGLYVYICTPTPIASQDVAGVCLLVDGLPVADESVATTQGTRNKQGFYQLAVQLATNEEFVRRLCHGQSVVVEACVQGKAVSYPLQDSAVRGLAAFW